MANWENLSDLLPEPKQIAWEKSEIYQAIIDQKTKPPGSLGALESLALQLAQVMDGSPRVEKPTMLVFAGDHGAAVNGISPFPQAVTRQMVQNFLAGGAAINVFARQAEMDLWVVDAGVIGNLGSHPRLLDEKLGQGTADYLKGPAMSKIDMEKAISKGRHLVKDLYEKGVNTLGLGEMGIGNSSSAALIMHAITGIPLEDCVGAGTGLDSKGIEKKRNLLAKAYQNYSPSREPLEVLRRFGGFEIAMMVGAYAEAAHLGMVILVDGFIASAAYLVAWKYYPEIMNFSIFSHCSAEKGHQRLLEFLKAKPLLQLGMRLGEGTGAALALPLVRAAAAMYTEMASFAQAGVSNRNG